MKPYFFPDLFLTGDLHEKLVMLFGEYMIIEPSGAKKENSVRYLDNLLKYENELLSFISEYRYLSDINPGIPKENLKFMKDNIHFKDDSSRASIRSDIEGDKESVKKDPIFNSAVFLQLTYDFDHTNSTLDEDLKKVSEGEKKMLGELKDADEDLNHVKTSSSSRYEERLQAWITLMNYRFESNFFLTKEKNVIETLLDEETFEIIFHEDISRLNSDFKDIDIDSLESLQVNNPDFPNDYLTLYKIKKGPEKFFEKFISSLPDDATNISDFTIIGLIS